VPKPRRDRAVHARGRLGRFVGGLSDYVRTAWWGLVSPRLTERRPLAISQAVVLRGEGDTRELLLTLRADLFGWELPGGTVERGETPPEALVREVREETGLEIELIRPVGDWIRDGFRPHTAHVFLARAVGGHLRPSHETPRAGWFPVAALPDELFPWYDGPIDRVLNGGRDFVSVSEFQGIESILAAMRIDLAMRWRGLPDAHADTRSDAS